jgi:hypothetical protein
VGGSFPAPGRSGAATPAVCRRHRPHLHVEPLEDRAGQEDGLCFAGHGCSLGEALESTRWTLAASGEVRIEIEAEGTMLLDGHELDAATPPQVDSIAIEGPGEGSLQVDAHGILACLPGRRGRQLLRSGDRERKRIPVTIRAPRSTKH